MATGESASELERAGGQKNAVDPCDGRLDYTKGWRLAGMLYSARLLVTGRIEPWMIARLRRHLMLVFAVPALLLGALYAVLGRQSLTGASVFYPAVMLYNYTAETLSTAILLVGLALLGLWIPQAVRRSPRFGINGLAVALALAGTALACWGSLPQVFAPYLPVGRATLDNHVYQLGMRFSASGESAYVLCECDGSGLTCRCHDLPAAGQPVTAQTQLLADPADGTLTIQAAQKTVYRFRP